MNLFQRVSSGIIRFYQRCISPYLPPACRYYPTCSNYALEAIKLHGFLKGSLLALWRILRCNPFSKGGVDPVPGSELDRQRHDCDDDALM